MQSQVLLLQVSQNLGLIQPSYMTMYIAPTHMCMWGEVISSFVHRLTLLKLPSRFPDSGVTANFKHRSELDLFFYFFLPV